MKSNRVRVKTQKKTFNLQICMRVYQSAEAGAKRQQKRKPIRKLCLLEAAGTGTMPDYPKQMVNAEW